MFLQHRRGLRTRGMGRGQIAGNLRRRIATGGMAPTAGADAAGKIVDNIVVARLAHAARHIVGIERVAHKIPAGVLPMS